MTAPRPVDAVLAAWLLALVIAGLVLFARAPADDSYIVARYAQNLWQGHGLVYNLGERVNALTSPAGLAVMALLAAVFADPVPAWQLLAALVVLAAMVMLALRIYATVAQRVLFAALALASPFVLLWTVGGLETALLYALAAWLAALALAPMPLTARRAVAIMLLAALAVLTRYDAVLFAGPVALATLWRARRMPLAWLATAAGGAVLGAWLLFCAIYFGDLLPTPFYVKLEGAAGMAQAGVGVEYVLSFALLAWLPLAFAWRHAPPASTATPAVLAAAPPAGLRASVWLGLALVAVYGIVAGSVHMMYAYRFFVPWLPVLWLCLLPRATPTAAPTRSVAAIALALQTMLLAVVWQYSQNPNLSLAYLRQTPDDERHELSLVGAREGAATAAAVRAQAVALRQHWQAQPESSLRVPRAAVDTGGLLPFLIPELYVFDRLVSYRHNCVNPAQRAADYWQVFRAYIPGSVAPGPPAPGWSAVSVQTLPVTDANGAPHLLELGLWFQPAPAAADLPATVNGSCTTLTTAH